MNRNTNEVLNWETNEILNWFLNDEGLYNLSIRYVRDGRSEMLKQLATLIPYEIDGSQVDWVEVQNIMKEGITQ